MLRHLLMVVVLATSAGAVAQPNNPQGWTSLVQEIKATKLAKISDLKGRKFDLTLPSATMEDTLELSPSGAFKVERTVGAKFQVTITNPEELVEANPKTNVITYRPIGWRVVQIDELLLGIAIEGQVSCRYQMRFSQTGANALDLSKFGEGYTVSWELSNPSQIDTVERDGAGLLLSRRAGATAPVSFRLRIKEASGPLDMRTDWIPIPACSTPSSEPLVVAPPTPNPPAEVPKDPPPEDCLGIKTNSLGDCEAGCGGYRITLDVTATNRCGRRVRCNNMVWRLRYGSTVVAQETTWVTVDAGKSYSFKVELRAAVKQVPFSVSPPDDKTCHYE